MFVVVCWCLIVYVDGFAFVAVVGRVLLVVDRVLMFVACCVVFGVGVVWCLLCVCCWC